MGVRNGCMGVHKITEYKTCSFKNFVFVHQVKLDGRKNSSLHTSEEVFYHVDFRDFQIFRYFFFIFFIFFDIFKIICKITFDTLIFIHKKLPQPLSPQSF